MNIKIIITIYFSLFITKVYTQDKQQQFRLLDLETALPITEATYNYGALKGVTDKNGTVFFTYKKGTKLQFSHVSYGSWSLSETEIKIALQQKVTYKSKITTNLYPITILGIRSYNKQPEEIMKLRYNDRIQHDASVILNQLPSFTSIQKGGNYGFDPVFRGFKYDQLNIVLNGAQSATAACPNRMDPPTSQMAPNMLDRIEVIKGPYALRYGTGVGATINFIPEKLRFTEEKDSYGRISSGFETNGDIARSEAQVGFTNATYDVNIFASWSQGNDYVSGNGNTIQADFKRGSLGADFGFKLNSKQQLRLSAIYNRARNADFPALAMDLRTDDTWLFNARHDIVINNENLKSWNTTLFGSFVDHVMDNLLKPLDPRMLNASTAAKTYNFGARSEGYWKFKSATLYAGVDFRSEGAKGKRTRTFLMGPNSGRTFTDNAWQDANISKTGVFGEYQIDGANFDFVVSSRLEINKAQINDAADEFANANTNTSKTQFNPSISFGVLRTFTDKVKASLWLGRAQRSGSLTERFINFFPVGIDPFEMVGNPSLAAEVNNQIDINLEWNPKETTSLSTTIFGSYLTDYISSVIDPTLSPRLPMSPGVRRFINIDEAYKVGFEFHWAQQLTSHFKQNLGIAYTYAKDVERNSPLPEIAPLDITYAISGLFANNKLQTIFTLRHVAKQDRIASIFGETPTPSFTLVNLSAGYQISDKIRVDGGINNLLDTNYYEHLSRSVRGNNTPIFAPGRNTYINLNYTF